MLFRGNRCLETLDFGIESFLPAITFHLCHLHGRFRRARPEGGYHNIRIRQPTHRRRPGYSRNSGQRSDIPAKSKRELALIRAFEGMQCLRLTHSSKVSNRAPRNEMYQKRRNRLPVQFRVLLRTNSGAENQQKLFLRHLI